MNNPFIKNGYLCFNASINKLVIEKMPTDKVNQDLKGKTALDIFSTQLFIEEIKRNYKKLNLDINKIVDKMLPQYLNKCLKSENREVKKTANDIMKLFGERLAVILLTLKKGEKENRLKRLDWEGSNWEYWHQIENIVLVGGLATSKLGEMLKYYIEKVFIKANEPGYNIVLVENPSDAGIIGSSTYVEKENENGFNLIFDFGQTFIKRSLVQMQNRKINDITKLDKILSKYVQWEFEEIKEEQEEAIQLHNYLLNSIIDTINTLTEKSISIDEHIVISIANYVENGSFANRGGYGKLRLISDNYEVYLSDELSTRFNKKFKVTFIHDGTAMAAAFSDYSKYVCISLGTAFGIGFPIKKE